MIDCVIDLSNVSWYLPEISMINFTCFRWYSSYFYLRYRWSSSLAFIDIRWSIHLLYLIFVIFSHMIPWSTPIRFIQHQLIVSLIFDRLDNRLHPTFSWYSSYFRLTFRWSIHLHLSYLALTFSSSFTWILLTFRWSSSPDLPEYCWSIRHTFILPCIDVSFDVHTIFTCFTRWSSFDLYLLYLTFHWISTWSIHVIFTWIRLHDRFVIVYLIFVEYSFDDHHLLYLTFAWYSTFDCMIFTWIRLMFTWLYLHLDDRLDNLTYDSSYFYLNVRWSSLEHLIVGHEPIRLCLVDDSEY